MSEPSSHVDKGLPPGAEAPDTTPAAAGADLNWDEPAYDAGDPIPVAEPASSKTGSSGKKKADNTPTVISRHHKPAEDAIASVRGRRLAHFELIEPIGVGGMAAVLKGRDLQLERIVALKILPPEMATDPESVRRFHQEARAAARLDHENIARVYYCGEDQKLHFIAFEFVQGENLRDILDRRGKLPAAEAVHYVLQIGTGLVHAANRGVVHRDIKPSNIIITPTGRAKLVDMGLARNINAFEDKGLTQSGVTLGTFDYISPEQALEPRDADVRSDIYSLGCTFYHMLTGQPPAPEGTAAKKLHFHEHELPVDPRQLNPDIPDEVAAILAKMMAKQPGDRYQRAEHLVQHLIRIAQKLEAPNERPDGVLFVDAPLPAPPTRPLLLAALGAVVVVGLIFFALDAAPPANRNSTRPNRIQPGADHVKGPADQARPDVKDKGSRDTPVSPGIAARTITVRDAEGLDALRDYASKAPRDAEIEIEVDADELNLMGSGADWDGIGLALRGKSVKLTGKLREGKKRPVLVLSNMQGRPSRSDLWTALRIEAETVSVRDLTLAIEARAGLSMTGLHLRGGRKVSITDCRFVQLSPIYDETKRTTSVLVERIAESDSSGPRAEVDLTGSAFLGAQQGAIIPSPSIGDDERGAGRITIQQIGRGGQDAITRRGPAIIEARNCVFGPHASCFRVEGVSKPAEKDFEVSHCSLLLGNGSAAFNVDEKAACRLNVSSSLFSRPVEPVNGAPTVLLREPGKSSGLQYHGQDNRYHNLDALWSAPAQDNLNVVSLSDFEARLKDLEVGANSTSKVIETSPWDDSEPLASLQQMRLADAFRVQPRMKEMRLKGLGDSLVGVDSCDGMNYAARLPQLGRMPGDATKKDKIVDPEVRESGSGIYKTLSQAIDDAQAGDTIHIKHTGDLPISPLTLDRPGLDVTIKPFERNRPRLVLNPRDRDSAMFKLHEGKIKFEDLEFRLDPKRKDFDAQAIVSAASDVICSFEGCIFTLVPVAGDSQGTLSVATLPELGVLMMRKPPKPVQSSVGPQLGFERCLIRGKGDFLWSRASRPFRLDMNNTLTVLDGSMLIVDARSPDAAMMSGGDSQQPALELQETTVLLTGHLLHVRPTGDRTLDLKTVYPIRVRATKCLFASLAEKGSALINLSRLDAKVSDSELQQRIQWKGGNHNLYVNHRPGLVEQQAGTVEMMKPPPYNIERWKEFSGEPDARVVLESPRFAEPLDLAGLAAVLPMQCAMTDSEDYGVALKAIARLLEMTLP